MKYLVMHYGSNNPNFKYRINNHELAVTASERDLGVIFSSDLKWKQQVTTCVSKANLMLGLIKKTFVSFDVKLVRSLYASYIRSLVEFSVPIWCPHLKSDINSLEKVQHRVTRLTAGFRKLAYAERLKRLGITTLEQRRKRGDLIQLFKIFNNIDQVKFDYL